MSGLKPEYFDTGTAAKAITFSNITISGGSVSGITDLAVADGGTGAGDAATARTNLGAQAQGDVLDDLNTLGAAAADGEFLVATGAGAFAYESGSTARTSMGAQAQGDVLDDFNTLGASASDGQIIVATGAGAFAYESGSTARTSLGAQAQSDVLDDLDTTGAAAADGEFLVATGAGAMSWESGSTARDSIGLGTGDSPQFTDLTLSGDLLFTGSATVIDTTTVMTEDTLIHLAKDNAADTVDIGAYGEFVSNSGEKYYRGFFFDANDGDKCKFFGDLTSEDVTGMGSSAPAAPASVVELVSGYYQVPTIVANLEGNADTATTATTATSATSATNATNWTGANLNGAESQYDIITGGGSGFIASNIGTANSLVIRPGSGNIGGSAIADESIVARTGGGDIGGIAVAANEIVGRAGGSLGAVSVAANTLVGRIGGDLTNVSGANLRDSFGLGVRVETIKVLAADVTNKYITLAEQPDAAGRLVLMKHGGTVQVNDDSKHADQTADFKYGATAGNKRVYIRNDATEANITMSDDIIADDYLLVIHQGNA